MGPDGPGAEMVRSITDHLEQGGLIAYPTETVYGFGGLARADAIEALSRLKTRPGKSGFVILVHDRAAMAGLTWSPVAERLADAFWPGPLTLVLPDPEHTQPVGVRSTTGAVAVRVSPNAIVAALTRALGLPLTSTSANLPGTKPAADGIQALESARACGAGGELWVLDGGALPPAEPSTMVDLTGPIPRILRRGVIPVDRLRTLVPQIHD